MAEYLIQDTTLTAIADGFRSSRGTTKKYSLDEMAILAAEPVDDGSGGGSAGGGGSVSPKAVNFYDYDGTVLHAYTKEGFLALTEMPPLPEREGLICQEWNWSFEDMRDYTSTYGVCNAGATYTTDDGTTRIYITLQEGRTSPMLGVCPNGTVTVDWGDGTTPDVLTGTSTSTVQWTPNHEYASPGDYVIRLTVDGEMGFWGNSSTDQYSGILRHGSAGDNRNYCYRNAVQKIEVGDGLMSIGEYAFAHCYNLESITIPSSVTSIGKNGFYYCRSLASITIPSDVTIISTQSFYGCIGLRSVMIPSGVPYIDDYTFNECHTLASVTIPNSVTGISLYAFQNCYSLASVTIPNSAKRIRDYAFRYCYSLASVTIPNRVERIDQFAFSYCRSLAFADLTSHTEVPTLGNKSSFSEIPDDFQIRVPATLYDEWIAATNWSSFASKIVAV